MIPGAKRGFIVGCLDKYDWMVYSPTCKGVKCKLCVLFKPTLKRGLFGAFIIKPFTQFYKIHEEAKKHSQMQCHKESTTSAKMFEDTLT